MARPSHNRMAAAPMMVRLSPSEREEFEAKAARARLNRSDAARAAFAAWQPEAGEANAIRYPATEETDTAGTPVRDLVIDRTDV